MGRSSPFLTMLLSRPSTAVLWLTALPTARTFGVVRYSAVGRETLPTGLLWRLLCLRLGSSWRLPLVIFLAGFHASGLRGPRFLTLLQTSCYLTWAAFFVTARRVPPRLDTPSQSKMVHA